MRMGATIGLLLSFLLLAGCAGYAPDPVREPLTLHLPPVINESTAPQLIAPLARNLRERLLHDRNWKLGSSSQADAVLTVRIHDLERDPVSRDPADTGRPLSYLERLHIRLEWDSSIPAPWGSDETTQIEVESLLYAQPGLIQSESIAYAEMADRAAAEILMQLNQRVLPEAQ